MKVLVACEESQRVCAAFRERGHEAYSCDIIDQSGGHPRNWVEKRDKEYAEYLGYMGLDMGVEMSNSKSEIDKMIELCKHAIGLDYKKPYHRHGKAFYKPYRNFFCTSKDDRIWNRLCNVGIAKRSEEHNGCVDFYLTRVGVEWLGRQLKITIKGTVLE